MMANLQYRGPDILPRIDSRQVDLAITNGGVVFVSAADLIISQNNETEADDAAPAAAISSASAAAAAVDTASHPPHQ